LIELGNLFFGHSRGEYEFPDRDIVNSREWESLMTATDMAEDYHCSYYENDVFVIRPYWWGEDDAPEASMPNFLYKPTGFEIRWYKYPFRDSYMNQDLTEKEIKAVFRKCTLSVAKEAGK
jgi:hypothetical protein